MFGCEPLRPTSCSQPTSFTRVTPSSVLTSARTGTSGWEKASRALVHGCAGDQRATPRQVRRPHNDLADMEKTSDLFLREALARFAFLGTDFGFCTKAATPYGPRAASLEFAAGARRVEIDLDPRGEIGISIWSGETKAGLVTVLQVAACRMPTVTRSFRRTPPASRLKSNDLLVPYRCMELLGFVVTWTRLKPRLSERSDQRVAHRLLFRRVRARSKSNAKWSVRGSEATLPDSSRVWTASRNHGRMGDLVRTHTHRARCCGEPPNTRMEPAEGSSRVRAAAHPDSVRRPAHSPVFVCLKGRHIMPDQPAFDQAKMEAFVYKVLGDTSAAFTTILAVHRRSLGAL